MSSEQAISLCARNELPNKSKNKNDRKQTCCCQRKNPARPITQSQPPATHPSILSNTSPSLDPASPSSTESRTDGTKTQRSKTQRKAAQNRCKERRKQQTVYRTRYPRRSEEGKRTDQTRKKKGKTVERKD